MSPAAERLPADRGAPISRIRRRERLRVSIELTNVCNFSCPLCPQAWERGDTPLGAPYDRPHGVMAPEVFERALAECNRVADTVELGFFGEQTLHPRYLEYVHALAEREFTLEFNTNLSYVTREMMDAWVAIGAEQVRLSLDAASPELFDELRPGRVKGLDGEAVPQSERLAVLEHKTRTWLARPDHRPTRIVFVKSSRNEGEREAFVAKWQPLLGPEDRILMKQVLSYGGKIEDEYVEQHRCNVWDMRYVMIDWRGAVSPCNLDTNMDLALGNVTRESLDALYRGQVAQRLRRETGCLGTPRPCRTCRDGNNWERNEIFGPAAEAAATDVGEAPPGARA